MRWDSSRVDLVQPAGQALTILPGGDVIAGGTLTTAGGVVANRIARYFFGAAAPSIAFQPLSQAAAGSSSIQFGIGATAGAGSAGPATYQWRKNGVAVSTVTNPSAATPVLSLPNVHAADVGFYDCLVTNSCGGPGTLSNAAMLSMTAPPGPPPCLADLVGGGDDGLSPDGTIDGSDFIAFINAFAAGC